MVSLNWRKDRGALQDHIFGSYISLRYGLAVIGVMLPCLIYVIGKFHGLGLQGSMSTYYWAAEGGSAPSRDLFVGGLFAVAACLYLYKGFTTLENILLNLSALFGVGVAVFPECRGDCGWLTLHGFCAVALFVCLALVVWFCAGDTLSLLPEKTAAGYRKLYGILGLVMLASPVTAFLMNSLTRGAAFTFWIECAGIWAFAAYWWIKSGELQKSAATKRALRGEIQTTSQGKAVPAPADGGPPPAGSTSG